MKIWLSMQGASLNVEVSDKKAMGIYRGKTPAADRSVGVTNRKRRSRKASNEDCPGRREHEG